MPTKPRLFISAPVDGRLTPNRIKQKNAIINRIAAQGFETIGFEPAAWNAATTLTKLWSVERTCAWLRHCDGMVILALAKDRVEIFSAVGDEAKISVGRKVNRASTFNHLEGGLAISIGLPVLLLIEQGVPTDGVFATGNRILEIPARGFDAWLAGSHFDDLVNRLSHQLCERRDIFLGYCSKANSHALLIRDYLEAEGLTVLDWSRDFRHGGATILEEIERASLRCRSAIFLFTKDDELAQHPGSVPRDNVVLEAGYFTRSLGKSRVAIVKQKGTKMPVDFGGIIYQSFEDESDLKQVCPKLFEFVHNALSFDFG